MHLLRLEHKRFTAGEIDFNNLKFELYYAKKHLKSNIHKHIQIIGLYGVTTKKIKELIQRKTRLNRHTLSN